MKDADICIIGSGITGVSAALHLANKVRKEREENGGEERRLKVVLLEAREFCKPRSAIVTTVS